jgi:diguanylate cyclase (GGDEF)-like protein
LTGLPNRRGLEDFLQQEWVRLAAGRDPFSIIRFEIDAFKAFNDTYGLESGDECLRRVAQAVSVIFTGHRHVLARYGGPCFVVALPEITAQTATRLGDTLRTHIQSLDVGLTITLGVATVAVEQNNSTTTLMKAADRALAHAKQTGRNSLHTLDFRT